MELNMKVMMQLFIGFAVFLYRLTGGIVGGKMGSGNVLLLDSVGRKSGKARTTPVMYIRDGNNYVVTASAGGAPVNPGWYYNLTASPHTRIQVMGQKIDVSVEEAKGDKREQLWSKLIAENPQFKGYETKTTRKIPMLVLKP
jgi:deazaflavin-dependent oxidoreductase (nitroreductase family)